MNLMILQSVHDHYSEVQFHLVEEPPTVGVVVDGSDRQAWEIVQVNTYQPANLERRFEKVFLAQARRTDFPLPEPHLWVANFLREHYPDEVLHVEIGGSNEFLGFKYSTQGRRPVIGEVVPAGYKPVGNSNHGTTLMEKVDSDWAVTSFETFLPEDAAPYSAIYLAKCQMLAFAA